MSQVIMLEPIEDRLVIKQDDAETVTAGGILIPDAHQQRPMRGRVIAAGPGRTENGVKIQMQVKVGDVVFFPSFAGLKIDISPDVAGGKMTEHYIIREPEVFCIEKPKVAQ